MIPLMILVTMLSPASRNCGRLAVILSSIAASTSCIFAWICRNASPIDRLPLVTPSTKVVKNTDISLMPAAIASNVTAVLLVEPIFDEEATTSRRCIPTDGVNVMLGPEPISVPFRYQRIL